MSEEQEDGLGEKLVADIMIKEVTCITPNMTVKQCIELLLDKGISGAPLVKEGSSKVVGVIGQKDLIGFAAVGGLNNKLLSFIDKVKKIDELVMAKQTDTIKSVIIKFLKNPVRRLLVVNDGGVT
jgi:CBS domain-containing protein